MNNKYLLAALLLAVASFSFAQTKPPLTLPQPVTETFFGKAVTDPYRHLENLEDPAVVAWYKGQAEYAQSVLESIPGRKTLLAKMKEFDARFTVRAGSFNITDNDRRFYFKMMSDDDVAKIYWRQGADGEEKLLFDPTLTDNDSTHHVVSSFVPNMDGSKVAIGVSANGSENAEVRILDVNTGKTFPERIDRTWGGWVSWLPDGNRFFIHRVKSNEVNQPDRLLNSKVYLHKVGTDPSADREFFSMEKYPELGIKPEEFPGVEYDKNSGWLFANVQTVDDKINNYIAPLSDLEKPKIQWRRLFQPSDEVYDYVATDKDIYFLSGKNAPRRKVLKTSLAKPYVAHATAVVPETSENKLWLYATSVGLFFSTNKNGVAAHLYHLPYGKTAAEEIKLPFAAGSVNVQTKGFRFPEVWVNVSGWTRANERYRYEVKTGKFIREQLTTEAKFPEFDDLVVEEIMVPSYDGVLVPLSLIYKKGLKRDGNAPVLLGGYGAYGASISPFFHPTWGLPYTLEGGIFAMAHVRGGGELGEDWHLAGQKSTKPNTWKDLIACSEFLIKERYTSPQKITIQGGSAGGILIGRAMTERPDLFAAAIPEVGCLNPMRQEFSPNGPGNVSEFGTVKDSAECMALLEMDAYHHLKPGVKYPATYITAGMNDPRVPAWQPGKFAAQLQALNASNKPILFFPDFDGGHGMGDTKSQSLEKAANMLSFGLWQSGVAGYQPLANKP